MSSGFTGGSTRGMSELDHEIEYRLGSIKEPPVNRLQDKLKHMDIFTDEFDPPGEHEQVPGADFNKRSAPYGKAHDDSPARSPNGFIRGSKTPEQDAYEKTLQPAGRADDQIEYDALDEAMAKYDKAIKDYEDQFPGSTMYHAGTLLNRLAEGVDEGKWKKAKDASQKAFGKIKWPFVQYLYDEWTK